jgi:p-cumate 2,3-dioxygenase ferredoxin component
MMQQQATLVLICAADDLVDGNIRKFILGDGAEVALAKVSGQYYAFADRCTHGEASLSEDGELREHVVECGWHCGQFDITTGRAIAAPCTIDLKTYSVVMKDGFIFIGERCQGEDAVVDGEAPVSEGGSLVEGEV